MTEAALYFWVQDGQWFRTGHNIGAYEVDQVLALGPEVTYRYREALGDRDEEDLRWWAGGAQVDADTRRLSVLADVVGTGMTYGQRAALLDTLIRTWPGWSVRWAYGGAAELVNDPSPVPPERLSLDEQVTKLPGPD